MTAALSILLLSLLLPACSEWAAQPDDCECKELLVVPQRPGRKPKTSNPVRAIKTAPKDCQGAACTTTIDLFVVWEAKVICEKSKEKDAHCNGTVTLSGSSGVVKNREEKDVKATFELGEGKIVQGGEFDFVRASNRNINTRIICSAECGKKESKQFNSLLRITIPEFDPEKQGPLSAEIILLRDTKCDSTGFEGDKMTIAIKDSAISLPDCDLDGDGVRGKDDIDDYDRSKGRKR